MKIMIVSIRPTKQTIII